MKKILFLVLLSSMLSAQTLPYKNPSLTVAERVNDLIARLTLDEKIDLLGGTGFATKTIARLGIPELRMTDGPVGARWNPSTAFPVSIAMAATWNPEMINQVGGGIGRETKGKGRHVILGPCVNIVRMPLGGRNFESFGEDPFLTSRIAVEYIKGVQKEGVAATIKHFAANNHEHERMYVDALVSERALNEIYFPAFKAGVQEADVLCLMNSYNKVNMHYAAENDYLLIDKLKKEWGFKGLVMSDWGAVHSSIPTAKGGMDLEMPEGTFLNKETLMPPIEDGTLPIKTIDDKVKRILTVEFKLGLFDQPEWKENPALVNTPQNRKIAYQTSLESIVLLKNDKNILPLKQNAIKTLAVIGPSAAKARTGGGGSAYVTPIDPVTPLDALRKKLPNVKIEFAQGIILEGDAEGIENEFLFTDQTMKKKGLSAEYYNNKNLEGKPKLKRIDKNVKFQWDDKGPAEEIGVDNFSVRWSGYVKAPKTGSYNLRTSTDDGVRLYFEDKLVIDDWNNHAVETRNYTVQLEEGKLYKIKMEYYEDGGGAVAILGWNKPGNNLFDEAVAAAKKADQVLLFVGTSDQIETEGRDRDDLVLTDGQDELITKVAEVNPNVVVVLTTGAPVVMDKWLSKVNGIVEMWFAGTEGGNAIADVLLGNYNPSGKLPVTFPKRWEDCSAYPTYKAFPARTYYADDIYVGYRHFDTKNIEPLFPFGFGLSYSSFEYSNLSVKENGNSFEVSFDLKNSGSVNGAEVAQLYVGEKKPQIDRPTKELKAFKKIELKAGETKSITLTVDKKALSYFDGKSHDWKLDAGDYELLLGASSRDIKLKQVVVIK
ncbi:MAG: glycoside hydrolase family 3 C-terminal domain-containing protein [Ignavibacteriales bacterium]|nr:glycoside hydrolase family 3 C-terminal domain-containing protein [Ignavibacteriales bacterium]